MARASPEGAAIMFMTDRPQNRTNPPGRQSDTEPWDATMAELRSTFSSTAADEIPMVLVVDDADRDNWDRPRRHGDFMSLYIARQGRGTHIIDSAPYQVVRGDVYVMRPGMAHRFERPENLILDTIHFAPEIFGDRTLDALASTPGFHSLFVDEPLERGRDASTPAKWLHLSPAAYGTVAAMFAELRREWESTAPVGAPLTVALFLRLLVFLSREYAGREPIAETTSTQTDTVSMAVRYIDERFADAIRVDELAASLFLSPGRFTEIFRVQMGCAPRDYLAHVRLEHAKKLLTGSDLPIAEIADRCGYPDPAHFARRFREQVGRSPRAFRSNG